MTATNKKINTAQITRDDFMIEVLFWQIQIENWPKMLTEARFYPLINEQESAIIGKSLRDRV